MTGFFFSCQPTCIAFAVHERACICTSHVPNCLVQKKLITATPFLNVNSPYTYTYVHTSIHAMMHIVADAIKYTRSQGAAIEHTVYTNEHRKAIHVSIDYTHM